MRPLRSLSVILPVFNGEAFLEEAVESVLNQTWMPKHLEILLLDDGSKDKSVELAHRLQGLSKRVRSVALGVNRGVATARNKGVEMAQYEHIAFLDQDDRWHATKLELQAHILKTQPEVDYVLGRQSFHLYQIKEPPQWFNPLWLEGPQAGWVPGTLVIERSKFFEVGPFDPQYVFGGDDVDWFSRAHELGLVYRMLDEVLLHRKIHQHNTSQHTLPGNLELLRLVKSKLDRLNA